MTSLPIILLALVPTGAVRLPVGTRRAVLQTASLAAAGQAVFLQPALASAEPPSESPGVVLPTFDADGKLVQANGYSEETAFRTVTAGVTSYTMLGKWVDRPDGGFNDPLLGKVATSLVITEQETSAKTIVDLGKPEQLPLVPTLRLDADLERADLVAAAVRKADGLGDFPACPRADRTQRRGEPENTPRPPAPLACTLAPNTFLPSMPRYPPRQCTTTLTWRCLHGSAYLSWPQRACPSASSSSRAPCATAACARSSSTRPRTSGSARGRRSAACAPPSRWQSARQRRRLRLATAMVRRHATGTCCSAKGAAVFTIRYRDGPRETAVRDEEGGREYPRRAPASPAPPRPRPRVPRVYTVLYSVPTSIVQLYYRVARAFFTRHDCPNLEMF